MGLETILAVIAAFAVIASSVNMAMAFKMNEDWSKFAGRLIDDMDKMNTQWAEFYRSLEKYRVYAKDCGQKEDKQ